MKRLFAMLLFSVCVSLYTIGMCDASVYPDGIYRGFYYEGGIEQIAIEFEFKDGVFTAIDYRGVKYKDGDYMIEDASDAQKAALRQYRQLANYLIGKGLDAVDHLYTPYRIIEDVDAVTTATMQSSKLISALWDGFNRRPYSLLPSSILPQVSNYPDGVYRGVYMDEGIEQISVEFRLRDNCFVEASFRTLQYKEDDYLADSARASLSQVAGQYHQLFDYLIGKPVSAVNDLYQPEQIAGDTDAFSGATLHSSKLISAVWDGLNRRAYRID